MELHKLDLIKLRAIVRRRPMKPWMFYGTYPLLQEILKGTDINPEVVRKNSKQLSGELWMFNIATSYENAPIRTALGLVTLELK